MAVIYKRPLQISYIANRFSFSYIFCWIATLAVALMPIFIALASNNFWIKYQTSTT
jgi:hypothetical protein